jgi:hypothetical protein
MQALDEVVVKIWGWKNNKRLHNMVSKLALK